jgi:hypothetical protein
MRSPLLVLAALAAAVVAALAPAAGANGHPPITTTTAVDDTYVFEGLCAFSVGVHDVGSRVRKEFFDADGNLVEWRDRYPELLSTLTNLDSGASVTVDASGSGRFIINPDGTLTVVISGAWVVPSAFPDLVAPGLTLIRGHGVVRNDHGDLTLEKWHGKVVDLCAVLA